MTLTLDLPLELEERLTTEADRAGLPVEQYAVRLLRRPPVPLDTPANGAELVAYWQREGVVGSRPELADSREHARAIRQAAERRG